MLWGCSSALVLEGRWVELVFRSQELLISARYCVLLLEVFHEQTSHQPEVRSQNCLHLRSPEASLGYVLMDIWASPPWEVCAMGERHKVCRAVWPLCTWLCTPRGSTIAVCRQGWGVWTDRLMWICAVRWLCRAWTIKSLQLTPLTGLLMTKSQLFLQPFLISILKKIGNDMVK